ncbi:hypothetical protein QO002_005681 [Pararhizobium capsulatum DSM 1112]|uniref:Uncharacterized protein n=1 Tax=Pararhizobium capsulatum DSM 1112 TaxID=1121113 RepID=A0ABU0BYX9_9HYPH|nr:hypothetical protein [Pararhizobium capsulatum]MDQ0323475.1 hypothetical protein [Pararhizobium capsulatum DSM 1112]
MTHTTDFIAERDRGKPIAGSVGRYDTRHAPANRRRAEPPTPRRRYLPSDCIGQSKGLPPDEAKDALLDAADTISTFKMVSDATYNRIKEP